MPSSDPIKRRRHWLKRHIRQKFDAKLTVDEYDAKLAQRKGLCFLCNKPQRGGRTPNLVLDHDHKTKRIREFLCSRCNIALGLLEDDVDLLRKAAAYIESFR
jgi:hypothetical protein